MPAERSRSKAAKRLVVLDGPRSGGAVWLIGAGPGDPELLTVKASRVLATADVVVHDGLVSPAILDLAPAEARRISVAKRKSHHSYAQEDINRLLIALALEGFVVARLKGGDPFVFGRGGEEVAACRAAGVECHVIPGITAALAAGAPLTQRGSAQAVTFVTGHASEGAEPDLDWPTLAIANQTVVVYMGLSKAASIATRLMRAGRAPATPVLVVENVSLPGERRISTRLDELAGAVAGLVGPALLMIGEAMAVALADALPASPTAEVRREGGAR
jgi:uroporphyrin-III C-methyltransferase